MGLLFGDILAVNQNDLLLIWIGGALILLIFTSCATSPNKMGAQYVSPLQFKDLNCDQVSSEVARKNQRLSTLYTSLNNEANADKWQMGVGLFLFWPSLLFLEGNDGPEATEYRRLKGEVEALEQAANLKKCNY